MRIAVSGYKGNIGSALVNRGVLPLKCDVTDEKAVRREIKKASPDIIIHTASKSKPDWCEQNTEECIQVNVRGSYYVALVAEKLKIPVVALSTDHVFSGYTGFTKVGWVGSGPYSENYHRIYPVNFYGASKFAMETLMQGFDNVKVVRTSNCFWDKDPRALWYIDQLYKESEVPVPTFQKRSFMHREHFVDSILQYVEMYEKMPKILHISGSETVDWYTFIKAFAQAKCIPESLTKKFRKKWFETDNFPAKRPKKAGLKTELSAKLGLTQYSYLDGMELLK